ncbi:MAG: epoxyqueuosine reductase QueH [Eubacteriales bacterium]|nr:epoxyqueuosine reductase QueH [Eubacteriales bacterium]
MNRINYQAELDRLIEHLPDRRRRLFLHSCCAPCSSYCLEYLRRYFEVTVFYYNPNITLGEEYRHRVEELRRLVERMNEEARTDRGENRILLEEGPYEPERFLEAVRGLEDCPEGGERCFVCYELRLREAAQRAAAGGYDFFTTTLTISPMKNAEKLNEIGRRLGEEYGVTCLPSDFKKKGGYQRSIELSREYGLYRQDYCGCAFSRAEAQRRRRP